jgi:transcriptional regulator with XRE-family HTH domain
MIILSNRIKDLRSHVGLSQEKFAERIGLSRSTLALIETDKSIPGYDTISNICAVFKVSPAYFFAEGDLKVEEFIDSSKSLISENTISDSNSFMAVELAKKGKFIKRALETDLKANYPELYELYSALEDIDYLSHVLSNFLPTIVIENISDPATYNKWVDLGDLPGNHPLKTSSKKYIEQIIVHLKSVAKFQDQISMFSNQLKTFLNEMKPLDRDEEINI